MNTPNAPLTSTSPVDAALQLILNFEVGGGQPYYDKNLRFPTQPTPSSGVTIGVGYDLGQTAAIDFTNDWRDQLDPAAFTRLLTAIGLTQQKAAAALQPLRDIAVPWPNALAVFRDRTLPQLFRQTRAIYPQLDQLPPDCQAALTSLIYNRGTDLNGPRRTEMRDIQQALHDGEFQKIPNLIRAMKRLWIAQPGGIGLTLRRNAEAFSFEHGLDQTA